MSQPRRSAVLALSLAAFFLLKTVHADTWARTTVTHYSDTGHTIARSTDNGYLVAGSSYWFGALVQKINSSGNLQWQKSYNGSSAEKLIPLTDGTFALLSDTSAPSGSVAYTRLTRISSQGDVLWNKVYETDVWDSLIQRTGTGYTMLSNALDQQIILTTLNESGDVIANKVFGPGIQASDLMVTPDSGYLIVGVSGANEETDGFVMKLNSGGGVEWNKVIGTPMVDYLVSVASASDGGFVVAGTHEVTRSSFCGDWDIWLLKISPGGNIQWQTTIGGTRCDFPSRIIRSPGGYIIAGTAEFEQSESIIRSNLMLMKVDDSGRLLWEKSYGRANLENVGKDVMLLGSGGLIVTGGTDLYGRGEFETLILKTDSRGKIADGCEEFVLQSTFAARQIQTRIRSKAISVRTTTMNVASPDLSPTNVSSYQVYQCSPLKQAVPRMVPRGQPVVLNGSGFGKTKGNSQIHLGSTTLQNIVSWSDQKIRLILPESSRTAPLSLDLPQGSTVPIELIVLPRTGETLWPVDGPPEGRTRVVFRRPYDMNNINQVKFGSSPATNLRLPTGRFLLCTTPPGSGTVDVTVSNGIEIRTIGKFTYSPARSTIETFSGLLPTSMPK